MNIKILSILTFSFLTMMLFQSANIAFALDSCDNLVPVDLTSHYNQLVAGNFSFIADGCNIELPRSFVIVTECLHPTYFTQAYISNYSIPVNGINATRLYVLWSISFPPCAEMPYFNWDWKDSYYNETVGKIVVTYSNGSYDSFDMRWRANIDDPTFCRNVPEAVKFETPEGCHYLVGFDILPLPIINIELQTKQNVYSAGQFTAFYKSIILQTEENVTIPICKTIEECARKIEILQNKTQELQSQLDEMNTTCQNIFTRVGLLESIVSSLTQAVQNIQKAICSIRYSEYLGFCPPKCPTASGYSCSSACVNDAIKPTCYNRTNHTEYFCSYNKVCCESKRVTCP